MASTVSPNNGNYIINYTDTEMISVMEKSLRNNDPGMLSMVSQNGGNFIMK